MKRLFVLIAIFCSSVFAQSESARIAKQIAPLWNENVVAVIHLDVARYDLDQMETALKLLLPDETLWIDDWNQLKEKRKNDIVELRKLGVQDMYFLVVPALFDRLPLIGAFPLPEKMPQELRDEVTKKTKPMNGQYVLKDFMLLFEDDRYQTDVIKLLSLPASVKPELSEALQSVEPAAVQLIVIPPDYVRRILAENTEPLPAPFSVLKISALLDSLNWVAFGFNTEKPQIDLIIQTKNEQSAQDLRQAMEQIVDFWDDSNKNIVTLQLARQFKEYATRLQSHEQDLGSFLKSFLPQQKANRLVLAVNTNYIHEKLNSFSDLSETFTLFLLQNRHRNACDRNLKEITLALHNYHDASSKLPPLYTIDKQGKPLHSWRVLILPYIEHWKLYKKIRLDEPWDSEYNRQFHEQCPTVYQCPASVASRPEIQKNGLTTYSAITGQNAWPNGEKKYDMSMITDGTSNTWAIVERKVPVCWMDPTQEITQEEAGKGINRSEKGIGAVHPSAQCYGTNVSFFDGSVHFYAENLSPGSIQTWIGRNDGQITTEAYDLPSNEPE